jgi:Family of unknown function (DUF6235)
MDLAGFERLGTGSVAHEIRLRLTTGLQRLERWSLTASQLEKNAVYRALFSIIDGSVFRAYRIVDDAEQTREFFVVIRDDLIIKIRLSNFDAFGIVYIGAPAQEPATGIAIGPA